MIKSSMVDDHSSVLRPGYNPLTHVLDVKRRGNDAGCPQDFERGKFARNRGLMIMLIIVLNQGYTLGCR